MTHCCKHNCLEELSSDHKKILEKLTELEGVIRDSVVDKDKIEEFLLFTETFAEPHHHKEEQVLFPALEKKGIPNEGGPIGMMLQEHEIKRGFVKDLKEALADNKDEEMKTAAKSIISLLREHIDKEENILYPCAKDALTEEELAALAPQCEKIK